MIDKIHWLGNASFKIANGKVIYIDPYQITGNEKADIILVTHDHYDHLSIEDIQKVSKPETIYIIPNSAVGMISGDVRTIKIGEKLELDDIAVEAVAAYNTSKQFHPKERGWVGYVITIDGTSIYHSGDTDCIPEMQNIKADIALLPCGGTYTMDAAAAAEVAKIIEAKIVIPMHWGSVAGTKADAEELKRLCPQCEVKILQKE